MNLDFIIETVVNFDEQINKILKIVNIKNVPSLKEVTNLNQYENNGLDRKSVV